MARSAKIVAAVLGIAVVAGALLEALSPDRLVIWLFYSGPRYLNLMSELRVDGVPATITQTVECRPKINFSQSRSLFDFSKGWYPTRYLISERLPNGSGVMIVVPRACNSAVLPPPNYTPLVLWVDSIDHPK